MQNNWLFEFARLQQLQPIKNGEVHWRDEKFLSGVCVSQIGDDTYLFFHGFNYNNVKVYCNTDKKRRQP